MYKNPDMPVRLMAKTLSPTITISSAVLAEPGSTLLRVALTKGPILYALDFAHFRGYRTSQTDSYRAIID